jgi:hypothetical protein
MSRFPKRQTAASMALMPCARPWRCGQAPQPRSGAPKAQGLTAVLTTAAPCLVPSCTATFSTDTNMSIDAPNTLRNYTTLTDAICEGGGKCRPVGIPGLPLGLAGKGGRQAKSDHGHCVLQCHVLGSTPLAKPSRRGGLKL